MRKLCIRNPLRPQIICLIHGLDFRENQIDLLHYVQFAIPNFIHIGQEIRKSVDRNLLTPLSTVTGQNFQKFRLSQQLFLKRFHTEFHENPTNDLVANISSQRTEGREGWSVLLEIMDLSLRKEPLTKIGADAKPSTHLNFFFNLRVSLCELSCLPCHCPGPLACCALGGSVLAFVHSTVQLKFWNVN
jgi:hypothetical protein